MGRQLRSRLHQGLHLLPWPVKVWVNGHEWAKQQARKRGPGFTELSNGTAACDDPGLLQRICDSLQPATIEVFFQRWLHRLPLPLAAANRDAGWWRELPVAQVEVSRTIAFNQPRYARAFFDALVTDNLDLGRPDTIEIIFDRQVRSDTISDFQTKVITRGTEVTVNAFYKHSRIKQYLKDGRALRVETVVNARLLHTERAGEALRPCQSSLWADRAPVGGRRRAESYSHAIWRLSGPGPGRRPVRHRLCRHRHHQQEPARPDARTTRHPLRHDPGQLRPRPAAPQRPDHPPPPVQHRRPHPRRPGLRHLLHQGPRPGTRAAVHRRAATSPPVIAPRSARSNTTSTNASPKPGCQQQSETQLNRQTLATKVASDKGSPGGLGNGAPLRVGRQ